MARPTSWVVSSALPVARTASSTRWPSWASASSVTGRPWHALRTPLMTLVRLKGSVTPDRFTTMSEHVSTVVKRREQSGHWRRLRIDVPSSVVRLSTTRLSGCLQKGQCMISNPPHSRLDSLAEPQGPREAALSIGDRMTSLDRGHHNLWAAVAIQPLDVGIGLFIEAGARVARERRSGAPRGPPAGRPERTRGRGTVPLWRLRRYRGRRTEDA
ncbi:exported protein of unknown function [Streptomyces murinus]